MTSAGPEPVLSFVVPVYNEEGNVEPLYAELSEVAQALGRPYEILFVNDGSQDATLERLAGIATQDPRLRIIDLDGNFGEAAALSAGFARARGEIVVTLDGDGQNPPCEIPRLLAALGPDVDVVSGRRAERKEAFFTRVLPSRVANTLIARLTRVPAHDCGCGLKAYRRRVLRDVQLPRGMNRFLPAVLGVDPRRVREVAVGDRARGSGASHYGLSRVLVVLRDLLALPLLVRHPPPGPATVRLLGVTLALLVAVDGLACAAVLFREDGGAVAAAVATTASLAAAATASIRHNVHRFVTARRQGVFRVRKTIHDEPRDHGDRLLGPQPAAHLPPRGRGAPHRAV
jgi:hypothetical protein